MKDFLKENISDLSVLAVTVTFYGGLILAACGLCLMQWNLCWAGLILTVVALLTMAVGCTLNDLRNIASRNTPAQTMLAGCRVVAEAVVCIFSWWVLIPVVFFADDLMRRMKSWKAK